MGFCLDCKQPTDSFSSSFRALLNCRVCTQCAARQFSTSIRKSDKLPQNAKELISVTQLADNRFRSSFNPQRHGSTNNISYGGIPLSHCIMAAAATVPANYFLFSCLGTYLGPTSTSFPVEYHVETIRSTKTFATRQVSAIQTLEGDKKRRTMLITLDFQVKEEGLFDYSAPPLQEYPKPANLLPIQEALSKRVKDGDVSQELVDKYNTTFPLHNRYFESKGCPSGVGWQNLYGMDKKRDTTQDEKEMTEKTNAMWFKSKVPLESHAESAAALSFIADGALAFMPLTHTKRSIEDAGPVSSLELAFRIFSANLDMNQWVLQEQRTIAAGEGRTFSAGRIFSESGKLLADMSQTCIMRKKK